MTIDAHAMLAEVRENLARLNGCKLHVFDPNGYQIGQRKECLNCGGKMRLPAIGDYIRGYEAGGGGADDIWPGYRSNKEPKP